jgi:hypothetical protein
MSMSAIRTSAIATATVTIVVAGCGSSDGPLSRQQLTAKANAVCKRMIVQRRSVNFQNRQQLMQVLPKLIAYERTGFAELSKLKPPKELRSDWTRFVEGGQTLVKDTVEYAQFVATYNRRSARLVFQSSGAVLEKMHETAKRDGILECAHFA